MPIQVAWVNAEKTVLLETFPRKWTLEEYFQLIEEAAAHLSAVEHTVHILVDGRRSISTPMGMIRGVRYAIRKTPPNQGLVVFVGVVGFTKSLIALVNRVFPQMTGSLHIQDTMDDAYRLIGAHNPKPQAK